MPRFWASPCALNRTALTRAWALSPKTLAQRAGQFSAVRALKKVRPWRTEGTAIELDLTNTGCVGEDFTTRVDPARHYLGRLPIPNGPHAAFADSSRNRCGGPDAGKPHAALRNRA